MALGVGIRALMIMIARRLSSNLAAAITFGDLILGFAMMLVIVAVFTAIAAREVFSVDPFEILGSRSPKTS